MITIYPAGWVAIGVLFIVFAFIGIHAYAQTRPPYPPTPRMSDEERRQAWEAHDAEVRAEQRA